MQTIHISDQVAARISLLTQSNGVGVDELLLAMLPSPHALAPTQQTTHSFDQGLDDLAYAPLHALPADFSRSDIYTDHD